MTKTICDICGKDMPLGINSRAIKDYNFCISSSGKIWDVCTECRDKLNEWMKKRKAESEDCRDCKKWEDCPCGKEGHESGTSQGYSIGGCKDFEPQESENKEATDG